MKTKPIPSNRAKRRSGGYARGTKDFAAGNTECPYNPLSQRGKAWNSGFLEAATFATAASRAAEVASVPGASAAAERDGQKAFLAGRPSNDNEYVVPDLAACWLDGWKLEQSRSRKLPRAAAASSMAAQPGAAADVTQANRTPIKNQHDPRGQFAKFLRAWIDKHHGGDESRLAESLGVTDRAIRKWCEGGSGPAFGDLDTVAKAMGYSDWFALIRAIERAS